MKQQKPNDVIYIEQQIEKLQNYLSYQMGIKKRFRDQFRIDQVKKSIPRLKQWKHELQMQYNSRMAAQRKAELDAAVAGIKNAAEPAAHALRELAETVSKVGIRMWGNKTFTKTDIKQASDRMNARTGTKPDVYECGEVIVSDPGDEQEHITECELVKLNQ